MGRSVPPPRWPHPPGARQPAGPRPAAPGTHPLGSDPGGRPGPAPAAPASQPVAERHPGCPGRGLARGPDRASTPWALLELPVLVGSRLLAQRHLRRRAPTSTPALALALALAILDHPIPWSRLELLAALPVTATAI